MGLGLNGPKNTVGSKKVASIFCLKNILPAPRCTILVFNERQKPGSDYEESQLRHQSTELLLGHSRAFGVTECRKSHHQKGTTRYQVQCQSVGNRERQKTSSITLDCTSPRERLMKSKYSSSSGSSSRSETDRGDVVLCSDNRTTTAQASQLGWLGIRARGGEGLSIFSRGRDRSQVLWHFPGDIL